MFSVLSASEEFVFLGGCHREPNGWRGWNPLAAPRAAAGTDASVCAQPAAARGRAEPAAAFAKPLPGGSWGSQPLGMAAAGGEGLGSPGRLGSWAMGGMGLSYTVPRLAWPAQHVLDRAQTVPVPHLCNVLLAFAHLNFRPERPEQEDQFFSLVRSVRPCLLSSPLPAGCYGAPGEQL